MIAQRNGALKQAQASMRENDVQVQTLQAIARQVLTIFAQMLAVLTPRYFGRLKIIGDSYSLPKRFLWMCNTRTLCFKHRDLIDAH